MCNKTLCNLPKGLNNIASLIMMMRTKMKMMIAASMIMMKGGTQLSISSFSLPSLYPYFLSSRNHFYFFLQSTCLSFSSVVNLSHTQRHTHTHTHTHAITHSQSTRNTAYCSPGSVVSSLMTQAAASPPIKWLTQPFSLASSSSDF